MKQMKKKGGIVGILRFYCISCLEFYIIINRFNSLAESFISGNSLLVCETCFFFANMHSSQ